MKRSKIIEYLKTNSYPFNSMVSFSSNPGVYALFFQGKNFPLEGMTNPKKDEIIYIGKTLSSQKSRNEKSHFQSGRTGSSTVRRTFGALLKEQLNLKAIPRNNTDKNPSSYTFDDSSEERLTEWMKANLALSFYEISGRNEIEDIENELISEVSPPLNIKGNPSNLFAEILKAKRTICRNEASGNYGKKVSPGLQTIKKTKSQPKSVAPKIKNELISTNVHKYEEIWTQVIPDLQKIISSGNNSTLQLPENAFKQVGNRKSYSFNIKYNNGRVVNNLGGSAVARDLARTIARNKKIREIQQGRVVKIRMDKNFLLHITIGA